MEHREYGMFGVTEGKGTSHFFTSGSEITTRSKQDFFWGARTHYGARHDIEVGCWMSLGYLFVGGFAGHAWDCVFSTRKTLSEQSRVKLGL